MKIDILYFKDDTMNEFFIIVKGNLQCMRYKNRNVKLGILNRLNNFHPAIIRIQC